MKYRFFIFFFLFLFITGITFANQIKYELSTTYPSTSPYYIGTTIDDLKISFVDTNNKILDINIANLDIKVGTQKYTLAKNEDYTYHLNNLIIKSDLITDSKLIITIQTLLPTTYTNTKQTFIIGNINDLIKLKSDPKKEYSNLTVGQELNLKLIFEDLGNQQIKNLNCKLGSFDSENIFNCETLNECSFNTTIVKNQSDLEIYCLFDKITIKGTKTYPLVYDINPTLSLGIKIGELTNPKYDGTILNPFEICFTTIYESGFPLIGLDKFKLIVDNEEQELYSRDNSFCFKHFLVPYTNLSKELTFEFNNQKYTSQINNNLKPGNYWMWFMIIVGVIILINIILILKAILSHESFEDLVKQRDGYKNRLVIIKEQYLQGDINKKEFESKLNEYSIKISWLNEKILQKKPSDVKTIKNQERQEQEINELNEIERNKSQSKKAPKELLNALFSEPNKEKVQAKDEDLIIEETQINDDSIQKLTKELNTNYITEEKKEGFFARLFKRKPKAPKDEKQEITLEPKPTEDKKVEEFKNPFKDNSIEDEFDIRKWQK